MTAMNQITLPQVRPQIPQLGAGMRNLLTGKDIVEEILPVLFRNGILPLSLFKPDPSRRFVSPQNPHIPRRADLLTREKGARIRICAHFSFARRARSVCGALFPLRPPSHHGGFDVHLS